MKVEVKSQLFRYAIVRPLVAVLVIKTSMASNTSGMKSSAVTIQDIFKTMEYGAVFESDSLMQDWLKSHKFGFFVNGEMETPADRKSLNVVNPNTGKTIVTVLEPNEKDLDSIIGAAHDAYQLWKKTSGHSRAKILYKIARNIQKQQHVFNVIECVNTGKAMHEVKEFDIPAVIRMFYYYAGSAQLLNPTMCATSKGITVLLPHWSFPALHLAKMAAPALAAGNSLIIVAPSETPLSAYFLADIFRFSGVPKGVINILSTTNSTIVKKLLTSDFVRKVSFIGPTNLGKEICRLSSRINQCLCLELSGKSAMIIFDSVDQDSVIEGIIDGCFSNNGQSNFAGSRLLIQETVFQELISKLKLRMSKLRVGNGMDKTMDLGAIINEKHLNKIKTAVDKARKDGAQIFQASTGVSITGNFFQPTLITGLDPGSWVALEVIFGPVVVAMPFRTAKESIALANNNSYGIAASVWTDNSALAVEVANGLKVGTVWINSHNTFDAAAPSGGCKQSGYGRHGGEEGLLEYMKPSHGVGNEAADELGQVNIVADSIRPRIDVTYKLYIGGAQVRPDGNTSREIRNVKGELLALVPEGSRKDIRNAVEAAQKAQPGWAKRSGHNRAQILYYIAENLERRRSEFTTGDETEFNEAVQHLYHWAAVCDKFGGSLKETVSSGITLQCNEPVGVIGIACPSAFPLLSFIALTAMAIARGNAVIVIPSETCPTPALDLCQVFDTSDVPGGVINVVTGNKDSLAETLVQHHDVNALWYFGSKENCEKIKFESAESLKRVWINLDDFKNWNDVKKDRMYWKQAVHCKTIWLPAGESFAN